MGETAVVAEEELDPFDDERIMKGLVTEEEMGRLKERLTRTFFEKAMLLEKEVVVFDDWNEFKSHWAEAYDPTAARFILYRDPTTDLVDMRPIIYHLLDTREGLFFAEWKVARGEW